jgi:hypothetical protein
MVRKKLLVLVALAAIACRPATALQLETIQTGKSLNSDNSVGNHTTRFRPNDTMNVAILTKGAGSGKIGVRWTLGGRVVNEESRDVSYRDSAATEFHLKYPSGLPPGDYTVEVLIDGKSVGTRNLKVEK